MDSTFVEFPILDYQLIQYFFLRFERRFFILFYIIEKYEEVFYEAFICILCV